MLFRIANREDLDQTASPEAVRSRSALFVYAFLAGKYSVQNFRTFTTDYFDLICGICEKLLTDDSHDVSSK